MPLKLPKIPPSDITPPEVYRQRRRLMQGAAAALALAPLGIQAATSPWGEALTQSPFSTDEALTDYDAITTYNNFYEYGTDKSDPARLAPQYLRTEPWTVQVDGACEKPGQFDVEALLRGVDIEERIYRLRCVEAWSMVVPWVGVELGAVLRRFAPTSAAKFVELTTLFDPEQMPGQRRPILDWPYVEGLRMDEAMHPLTILAIGLYGERMPAQNGAPLRLVVPWKYGFKSVKSIVHIRFTEQQPLNTWQQMAPNEYGFYANVNPEVDHPRWSQARERRIGEFFRRDTLPFNGYGEQVAQLYRGMDPRQLY